MQFLDHPVLIAFVAVLSWPVYTQLAKLFFGKHYESADETVRDALRDDMLSLFKGRLREDWNASFMLGLFLFLCAGWVASISELICRMWY
jgi:hypothetical protein